MRVTRLRGFKAATVVAVSGAGAGLGSTHAGAAALPTADGVAESSQKLPGVGIPLGTSDGITVYDSSGVKQGEGLADVDSARSIPLEPAGDDAPVGPLVLPGKLPPDAKAQPAEKAAPAAGPVAAAANGWCGSMFQLRGGSLVPPYDGRLVYWDAPGPGYEVRRIIGAECLNDNQNFSFQQADAFKVSDYNSTYGRRVVHKDGWILEGCSLVNIPPFGASQYQCDFKSNQTYRLTPQRSSAFFRERLKNWAMQTVQNQGQCATTIIGNWVGTNDLNDVGVDCIDNGPINPAGL
jgi:hypothetical protein